MIQIGLSLVYAMLNVWVWLGYFMSHLATFIAGHIESFALANALVLNAAPVCSRVTQWYLRWLSFHQGCYEKCKLPSFLVKWLWCPIYCLLSNQRVLQSIWVLFGGFCRTDLMCAERRECFTSPVVGCFTFCLKLDLKITGHGIGNTHIHDDTNLKHH